MKLYDHQAAALAVVEEYRLIKGYEELYAVSNIGNVYSIRNAIVLKPCKEETGYMKVNLYKQGDIKHFYVHRLVAEAFVPNPNKYRYVNHIDCDKTNNKSMNLEWCTAKYNIHESMRNGLQRHNRVVITEIKTGKQKGFYSMREACRFLNTYQNFISIKCKERGNVFSYRGYRIEVMR